MKKAIKINLSGIIFDIDDDAYEKLKSYLDSIGRHFSNKEESKEIINDIESRIAELFQERITSETQVITVTIVNEVIDIMGNPEDIADTVILVGDPGRVSRVSSHFDRIEVVKENKEFVTHTGTCGGKRISVLSSLPSDLSDSTIFPIPSSILVTMAA